MMKREKPEQVFKDGLKIVFEKDIDMRDKYIALGFHGLGGIGHLTTRFLVESAVEQGLGEKVGYIMGRMIPPFVEVLDNGRFGFPYELFLIEDKVLTFLIRIQPWLDDQPILADIFSRFAKENGVKSFILFGGVDVNVFPERGEELPIVYVANEAFLKSPESVIPRFDIDTAPKGILVSGGISLFLEYSTYRNIPALALFSPTTKGILDKKGAYKLAKKFTELVGLNLNLDSIKREIEITQKVLESIQQGVVPESEEVETKGDDFSQVFT